MGEGYKDSSYISVIFDNPPTDSTISDFKEMKYLLERMVTHATVTSLPWGDEVTIEFAEIEGREYARKLFGMLSRQEDIDMTIRMANYLSEDKKFTAGIKLEDVEVSRLVDKFTHTGLVRSIVFQGNVAKLDEDEVSAFVDEYFKWCTPDSNPTAYKRLISDDRSVQGPIQWFTVVDKYNY